MGLLKFFGSRRGEDPAAVKQPSDQNSELVKLTDDDVAQFLSECIKEASEIAGISCDLTPKHMGASHGSQQYKRGRYVFIQNFDDLGLTKTVQDDRFVRFNFRAVEDERHLQPLCPVLVQFATDNRWMPRERVDSFIQAQRVRAAVAPGTQPEVQCHVHAARYGFMQPEHRAHDPAAFGVAWRQTLDFLAHRLAPA